MLNDAVQQLNLFLCLWLCSLNSGYVEEFLNGSSQPMVVHIYHAGFGVLGIPPQMILCLLGFDAPNVELHKISISINYQSFTYIIVVILTTTL